MARLTQDNSLVKQRADMLQHQLEYVQDRNEERERELESLRYQHVELSTASDQKATVGQLQQQILTMKVVIYMCTCRIMHCISVSLHNDYNYTCTCKIVYMYYCIHVLLYTCIIVYMYYCIHVFFLLFLLYITC